MIVVGLFVFEEVLHELGAVVDKLLLLLEVLGSVWLFGQFFFEILVLNGEEVVWGAVDEWLCGGELLDFKLFFYFKVVFDVLDVDFLQSAQSIE